ncbi:MAG: TonB-dependent receptor plug domain-containing protein [Bryobacteraceae bacterium]
MQFRRIRSLSIERTIHMKQEPHIPFDCFAELSSVRAVICLLVVVLMISASARAEDVPAAAEPIPDLSNLSLKELGQLSVDSVYTASKYQQKTTEAPASVTIVTAAQIERYGYRTLAEILRSVRGFYVTYDRNYSFLGTRGFARPGDYNTRVLLLIDGHRVNDIIFDGALIGTEFPLDVDLIDRVEIIRGPSSSLYGTSAFFGVINVITKQGRSLDGAAASGELASLGTYKGRVSYGKKFQSGLEMLLSSTSYKSHGQRRLYFSEFDDPATNNGIAEHADADGFSNFFGKLSFRDFTLHGLYGSRDKSIPTASFGTVFNDPRSRTIEQRGYLDLQHEKTFANRWELVSRLYYDAYGYDGDYLYDHSDGMDDLLVFNRDLARGNWWGSEIKASRKLKAKHTLTLGTEYRNNFRQDQMNYDKDPFIQYLDDRRSSANWAFYVQDEYAIHRKLIFNAGLRFDHYDTFGGTTNPRLGLIYNPFEETTVKLLYGHAFRAPSFYELFWWQNEASKANPRLNPETINTPELVLEQRLGKHIQLTAAGFYYAIDGLITQKTDPADNLLVYQNLDKIQTKGLELELEGKWASGVEGRVAYTLQDGKNLQTGSKLRNSPRDVAKFNLSVPLARNKLFAGFATYYVGKRATGRGSQTGAALVSDFTLFSRRLINGFDLSANVHNLFNQRYAHPGSEEHVQDFIRQDGRTFRVKLTFHFPAGK